MHVRTALLAACLAGVVLSGCAAPARESQFVAPPPPPTLPTLPGFTPLEATLAPAFSAPALVDEVRAGGEPVVAVLPSGTLLVSSHPGWTHVHDATNALGIAPLLTPANGQSYLWRSTDDGATWQHVTLLGLDNLPRSTAPGVSDPDFTVMEDGTVCMTDLEALAMASVSCSSDDGATWLLGNAVASGGPNDRQWLASLGDELYFTANYFVDHRLRASSDKGLTWEDRGDVPCAQDLVANRATGHLVVACEAGIAVSEDRGFTWSEVRGVGDGAAGGQRIMAEPAVDSAGNVWVTYTHGERALLVAGTPDEGRTWPWVHDLTPHVRLAAQGMPRCILAGPALACEDPASPVPFSHPPANGTFVWPWVSAGSAGRLAVSWIHSFGEEPSDVQPGPWHVLSATVVGADANATGPAPSIAVTLVTPQPIHVQPICQSGTTCQVGSVAGDASSDRRLGDFFETTVGPDGHLRAAWSNTVKQDGDAVSHPEFARQVGGVRLIADGELGTFRPTQG